MYYIKDAKVRRMTELDGVRCAEIGVLPGAVDDPALLAYVAETSPGLYDLIRLIRNDADTELDWYDNTMHQAYTDVTKQAFEGSFLLTPDEERDLFLRDLLSFGSVEEDLRSRFAK
ncbi:hypothetical protein [Paenibacillus sp. XY044]|uniref:hypothetical protein n=1 Tax=Paenibacillus sp. XY044 TaxID=2026089 RepID=UPI000B9891DE|nr:hypothetical protein [Paenibacillus sp. XY044]OZB91091.1 hypothetical protein CJP46_30290 [Paenibacillus sp. XY044]